MNLLKKVSATITKALQTGYTPDGIARSCAVGLYIAFSPFPGLHGVMMLACSTLFKLHLPTVFLAGSLNNPWTMVPFYSFDYAFGPLLVRSWGGYNPSLTISAATLQPYVPTISKALSKVVGSGSMCLWSFLIGGNVAGILAAALAYPLVRKMLQGTQTGTSGS